MSGPSPGFGLLTRATAGATFVLILLGGVVRVSDSGLGCGPAGSGLSGWPLCRGDVVPGVELTAVIEYSHRALASVVGLAILALAALAWRHRRERPRLAGAAASAAGLVIAQGLLGAMTVELNLDAALVAIHLGLAMMLLALLLYMARAARGAAPDPSPPESAGPPAGPPPHGAARGSLRVLSIAAAAAVLATIVAGGYVAGTENNGRTDETVTVGAHFACGKEFPTCNGEILPFGKAALIDVHLTHRALMYVASALILALLLVALRRRPSRAVTRMALTSVGLLAVQVLLGALNVWVGEESSPLILAHLAVATLLWASLIGVALALSTPPAERPGDGTRSAPAGEPVAA